ncbi:hypothetical protein [Achromobacter pulmonis]|uniref:hypothetical protein n=1 Tax=Achromobacter pulmonis TaxID=1389932 RepID=UPI0015842D41|nr:hypothetical protein [Achromobacter pulmonis]
MLALFNQDSGESAQRVTERVEDWFIQTAFYKKWAAAAFVQDAMTAYSGGCILMSEHALAHARNTGNPTFQRLR